MIAYFRLAVNPNDEEALKRVINYPARGIGQTTLDKITGAAAENGISLWQVLLNPAAAKLDVNRGTLTKLESFTYLIQSFINAANSENAAQLGMRIARESGVQQDIFRGREPEDISRQENLQELLDGMQQFVDDRIEEGEAERTFMTHYLQEVSLLSDLDESSEDSDDKLTLMTVHAAKGLEFRVVFVVGMEENLFPNQMASSSPRELEEERRLFYVAITRAKEQCFLTNAQNRYRYGKSEFCNPSPFLSNIDSQYLEIDQSTAIGNRSHSLSGFRRNSIFGEDFTGSFSSTSSRTTGRERPNFGSKSSSAPAASFRNPVGMTSVGQRQKNDDSATTSVESTQTASGTLKVGQQIAHSRFGRGKVVALTGTGIDAKATVEFENVGTKQLLLRFAKFTIL